MTPADRVEHHRQLPRQDWHEALRAKLAGNPLGYRAHSERARLHEAAAVADEDQAADR